MDERTAELKSTTEQLKREITERKKTEEALRESEKRFTTIFETANDVIVYVNTRGKILEVNRKVEDIIGYTRDEVKGKNFAQLGLFRLKDAPQILKLFKDSVRQGRVMDATGEGLNLVELAVKHKEGYEVIVETGTTAVRENGELRGFLSILRDITERKRTEEALRESEKRFRTLFEATREGIVTADPAGRIVSANPAAAKILGYECSDELVGMYTSTFYADPKQREVVLKELMQSDYVEDFEILVKKKDGSHAHSSASIMIQRDGDGNTLRLPAIFRDITERKKAEKYLREQKEILQTILDNIPVMIAFLGSDSEHKWVNRAWEKNLGWSLAQAQSCDVLKELYPDPEYYQYVLDFIGEAESRWADFRTRRRDGTLLDTTWTNVPLSDGSNIGIGLDITERKRVEEESRASKERFQRIIENAPFGYYRVGKDGLWQYVNPVWERMHGLSFEEVVGKSFEMTQTEDAVEKAREIVQGSLAGETITGEFSRLTKNGSIEYHSYNIQPVRQGGKIVAIEGFISDITERKRAEGEIRKLTQYLESIIDNANIWLDVLDEKANVVMWNKAAEKISGFSREEIIGHGKIWEWLYPDEKYRNEITTRVVAIINKGEVVEDLETTIRCKNGETRIISWNSRNLLGADDKPIGSIALGRDVTERKKLMQQLIQSEKSAAVGTLAYGIAHEFNNILAGIMVNAEVGITIRDYQEIKECFQAIVENSHRGSSIANSLLAVAGERKEKKELISVVDPLQNVLSFVRRELEKANVQTVEELKPVPQIFCDPGQFSEVFLNMITNARDAMHPKGGTLTVKVARSGDDIRIVFKDTGCGIPDQIKGRIFDPFVTTKGALGKSDIPGTGLGLFLSCGIIDSYNGKIEVESKVGKGTTFTILIPVSKNLPPKTALRLKRKPPEEITRKLNVLLVDDEQVICRTLKRFLESKGHQVTASLKAKEGLELFKRDKFDVVLSDITIPDMDGIELIKKMRKKDQKTKIIVITGHFLKEKEEEAKNAGADEVLVKPFRNALLYETMARLCSEDH